MALKYLNDMNAAELEAATFGEGFKRDVKGQPIEQGMGSDAYWRSGKQDILANHLAGIRRAASPTGVLTGNVGAEEVATELDRINRLRAAGGFPPLKPI